MAYSWIPRLWVPLLVLLERCQTLVKGSSNYSLQPLLDQLPWTVVSLERKCPQPHGCQTTACASSGTICCHTTPSLCVSTTGGGQQQALRPPAAPPSMVELPLAIHHHGECVGTTSTQRREEKTTSCCLRCHHNEEASWIRHMYCHTSIAHASLSFKELSPPKSAYCYTQIYDETSASWNYTLLG